MTVTDLIISAMRLVGIVGAGQTPSISELYDAMTYANAMLDNWNAQHLYILTIREETPFNLSAGVASYTIGSGGNINTDRPVKIESAGIIQANGLRSPLTIINSKRYALIPEKTAQAIQPLELYCDNDFPLAKLYLWPAPRCVTTTQLALSVWEALTQFTWREYTDLVINGTSANKVTSAGYPFTSADVGRYLHIMGGTGFTLTSPPTRAKVNSVLANVATLDRNVGATSSTGGVAIYDEDLSLAPAYSRAIRFCLAVDLANEWGRPVPDVVAQTAATAKNDLAGLNATNTMAVEDLPPSPPAPQAQ